MSIKVNTLNVNIINVENVEKTQLIITDQIVNITINIYNLIHSKINKKLKLLFNLKDFLEINTTVTINFININDDYKIQKIITKCHDILYKYNVKTNINILINNNPSEFYNLLISELDQYKNIVIDPYKNPESYFNFIKSKIPDTYICDELDEEYFPLTRGVGSGSKYNKKAYMIHIKPKNIDSSKKDIYLVGKAITYDSGGINIKPMHMDYMKIDMTGSAIVLYVLRLLNKTNFDTKFNIHLVIPIAENMISNTAIKPGDVIETFDKKKVEIFNTDAEGRLCMADALVYINNVLINKDNIKKSFILDIATLTGNTIRITDKNSSVVLSNDLGETFYKPLFNIGEKTGDYVDHLNIRNEHLLRLSSSVADIKNGSNASYSETVVAGAFLKFFVSDQVPWIHIDVASMTYDRELETPLSYGIMLLYNYFKYM